MDAEDEHHLLFSLQCHKYRNSACILGLDFLLLILSHVDVSGQLHRKQWFSPVSCIEAFGSLPYIWWDGEGGSRSPIRGITHELHVC